MTPSHYLRQIQHPPAASRPLRVDFSLRARALSLGPRNGRGPINIDGPGALADLRWWLRESFRVTLPRAARPDRAGQHPRLGRCQDVGLQGGVGSSGEAKRPQAAKWHAG